MRAKVSEALSTLPHTLAENLTPIVQQPQFDATISAEQFAHLLNKTGMSDNELRVALLPVAAAYSIAPISNFFVGAIVRGLSGRLYFGANMEFTGTQLGQTVHAEQSAISHAWVKGETGVKDITINYSPCGHCRQFMNELSTASDLKIQLPERDEKSLHDYLPESFGPADLGITTGLMAKVDHQLTCPAEDQLITSALQATNKSHAPYSKNTSGVAIRTTDGRIFEGMYAENAAFNPSLPPLQVALINMNMANYDIDSIEHVALVEKSDSTVSHLAETQSTLESLNPDIKVDYLAI
ncbi:cytidine deaminase [Vibrio sp. Of7-15]|uniref:cytidine deaminase n=1 Tax=Vibrio sp. Of7-15 TaxID=2724879 RepID=UPI001EF30010|nr:cytidine deaminase [Vibrio sp. Of7-15]MCG7498829.1 cytidine deaminase [Vibrio sp. Of7-15]